MNDAMATSAADGSPRVRLGRVCVLLVVFGGVVAGALWWHNLPRAAEYVDQARADLSASRFDAALLAAEEAIRLGEDSPTIHLLAGEAATRLERFDSALEHFERVGDSAGRQSFAARLSTASVLIHQHRIGEAEDQLRRALLIRPQDEQAHQLLADVLGFQGRRWESIAHLQFGIMAGDISLQRLCYLADTDRTMDLSAEQLAAFLESNDPRCWLGAACVLISYREFERARSLLVKCLDAAPELVEGHARLGKLLLSDDDPAALVEWESGLPERADEFPDIWFVRSQWCLKQQQAEQAAACLWRALTIHADHSAANHQMANVLTVLGRLEEAEGFRDRGRKLTRLSTLANDVYLGDTRSSSLQEAAQLTESMGRIHEAMGWAVAARYENPQQSWPLVMQQRLGHRLSQPAASFRHSPAQTLDFSDVRWQPLRPGSPAGRSNPDTLAAAFRDVAPDLGIDFRYENADDPSSEGKLMFEYTGGGVGALDYDRDGWPDLYFTQAGNEPPFRKQSRAADVLYRNVGGHAFADISAMARIRDYGFGQGVAAGDVNNDGFTDLYVANIDGNRLYLNRGDGTFDDVTAEARIGHSFWTTSVAIADLNGDSIPDLYDVTFLSDEDVFERVCEEDGVARSCAPAGFAAADDFIYQGNGDGTYTDVSERSGIRVPDGDGLGILVADFAASGTPSIFIANDGRANFYFIRQTGAGGQELLFSEQALARGLAFDRDGRPQACMGVASSDFDGDGNWDMFVTNFFNESNTLYSQFAGEVFGDSSQLAGLRETSLSMLGFGTQAIDGNLDGWEDLMVANGHVDDFGYKGVPYRMPLEYYRNMGQGNFQRVSADQLGEVFDRPMLGRSMAIIDWNADGRAEVAVSGLEDPAVLLENSTADAGRFLAVRVVGIQSARDATTARLTAALGGRELVRQFTAGDGYQSSNQKQVIFGLGDEESVDELRIQWPSGQSQIFRNLTANQTIVLREGEQTVWPLTAPGEQARQASPRDLK